MGCDIHCYIEYKKQGDDRWRDFGGRINPGRNYWMFGAMAGVRTDHIPHLVPRGWPEDCAYAAFDDNTIYVDENLKESFKHEGESTHYSQSHAEEYVAKGYCKWIERNGLKKWVTNSDWHSHSWLTANEFEVAIAAYLKASGFLINTPRLPSPEEARSDSIVFKGEQDRGYMLDYITEYLAILQAMLCFEAQGHQARLVFWFDN